MSTKLYVGNLAFQTTSQELQELFAQAGTVESASVVEDRDTGRSRGFAFVEMSTKEEATAAIDQFNGKELGGRALKVNEAKPRENRAGGGGRGFGGNRGGGGYGGERERGGGGGGGRGRGGEQVDAPARRPHFYFPFFKRSANVRGRAFACWYWRRRASWRCRFKRIMASLTASRPIAV